MTRLWSRIGARAFAVGVLLLALVGGVALGVNRDTQRQDDATYLSMRLEGDETHQLKLDQAAHYKATAPQRAAQADAQAKAAAAAASAAAAATAADAAAKKNGVGTTKPANYGPIPASCAAYTGNKAIGCALMLQWGYGLDQMPCLEVMWTKESGWNEKSRNPSSGSYGIPQALPASKMAAYGSDYLTNPATQIKWGLDYIKNRYKSPCGAWTFWQAHSWY